METFNESDFKHLLALLSLKIQTLFFFTKGGQNRSNKGREISGLFHITARKIPSCRSGEKSL